MPDTALPTASFGRRILALLVDWLASTLVVIAFAGASSYASSHSTVPVLLVYVFESAIFTWLLGGSFGKLVTGLCVLPADGVLHAINPLVLVLRQVLVALVIPPLVFRADGRGLHDVFAGTVTVRVATFNAVVAKARARA